VCRVEIKHPAFAHKHVFRVGPVNRVLAGVKPLLMVCDQPYGVNYDPAWRKRAGVNNSDRCSRASLLRSSLFAGV
jgi:hypothetical protein